MSAGAAAVEISHLRARMERMQGRRLDAPVLPVPRALARLLPGGGLRPGSAYEIGSSVSLLLSLMAGPTRDGAWCAAVGMPELGAEAAEQQGVDLARLVLVPDPGTRWLAVTAAVADVLPVVAVRVSGRVPAGQAARLSARLRERGCVLLVQGPWPQAEASLQVETREWTGLGAGHGRLRGGTLTVTARSRRWGAPRRARLTVPADPGFEQDSDPGFASDAGPGAGRDAALSTGAFAPRSAPEPMRAVV